ASSGSVPGRKVTVVTSTPSVPATDLRYIMPSTPLIASSSGVATVSAITLGLAPGYTARTTTVGGTTSGDSLIGNIGIAIRPAAKITIDSTAAKIGRSMKNLEKSIENPWRCGCRADARKRPAQPFKIRGDTAPPGSQSRERHDANRLRTSWLPA